MPSYTSITKPTTSYETVQDTKFSWDSFDSITWDEMLLTWNDYGTTIAYTNIAKPS